VGLSTAPDWNCSSVSNLRLLQPLWVTAVLPTPPVRPLAMRTRQQSEARGRSSRQVVQQEQQQLQQQLRPQQ
jgi:hypothetical protein